MLGHVEEELLERRDARCERGDADPSLAERDAEGLDCRRLGLETQLPVLDQRPLDPVCEQQRAGAFGLAGAQRVAASGALEQFVQTPFVDDLPLADDRDAVAQFFYLGEDWLESRIVMPSEASRFTSSRMSRMPAGSSPVVGSSSSSSFGSRRSDAAMPSLCRIPCE